MIPRIRRSLRGVLSCCTSVRGRAERTVVLSEREATMGEVPVSREFVGMGVSDVTEAEGT